MKIIAILMLIILAGCARPVYIHPIEIVDIIAIRKGEMLEAPKDGFFLSKEYVRHVMRAKVVD